MTVIVDVCVMLCIPPVLCSSVLLYEDQWVNRRYCLLRSCRYIIFVSVCVSDFVCVVWVVQSSSMLSLASVLFKVDYRREFGKLNGQRGLL